MGSDNELMRRAPAWPNTARSRTAAESLGGVRDRRRRRDRGGGRHATAGRPARGDRGPAVPPATGPRRHRLHDPRALRAPRPHRSMRRRPRRRRSCEGGRGARGPRPPCRRPGIASLPREGIAVDVGVGADAARAQLAPYLVHRRIGRATACSRRRRASTGASPRPTAPRSGSPAPPPGPTRTSCGRLASRGDRRGHRARRPSHAHRARRRPPVEHQPLRVLLDAPRPRARRRARCSTADSRAHARDHHRRRVRPSTAPGRRRAPRCRRCRSRDRQRRRPPAALDALAAMGCCRRWSKVARRSTARCSTPGSSTVWSRTSAPTCSAPTARRVRLAGPGGASPTRPAGSCIDVTRLGDDVRLDYGSACLANGQRS